MNIKLLRWYRKQACKRITWFYNKQTGEITFFRRDGFFWLKAVGRYQQLRDFTPEYMQYQLRGYQNDYIKSLVVKERFKRVNPKTIEEYVLFSQKAYSKLTKKH